MKRNIWQNSKFWWLITNTATTEAEKASLVEKYTLGRTCKSSEMNSEEMEMLLYELRQRFNEMNRMRRKIFALTSKIKLAESVLNEQEVLRYIHNIVGLNLPQKPRLNDYTQSELKWILQKLEAIAPKQQRKYRKEMKLV